MFRIYTLYKTLFLTLIYFNLQAQCGDNYPPSVIRGAPCGEPFGQASLPVISFDTFTYEWEDGYTENYRADLAPGNYEVTISNVTQNCSFTRTIEIVATDENYASLRIYNEVQPTLMDSTGAIVLRSMYSSLNYLWSTGETTSQIFDLSSGLYSITVTLPNDECPLVLTGEILQGCDLRARHTAIAYEGVCGTNGAVELRTSEPHLFFIWENGDTVTYVDNLTAGLYNYTVVDTTGDCQLEQSIRVFFADGATSINFHATCNTSGLDTLTAFFSTNQSVYNPATYIWENGQVDINATFSQLNVVDRDSVYNLTVISSEGCENQLSVLPSDYCNAPELESFARISFGSTSIEPGDTTACIPVSISTSTFQSNKLIGYQGSITYDTSLLEFVEVISEDADFFYSLLEAGELRAYYADLAGVGFSYNDTTLFTACFKPLFEYGIARVEATNRPLVWEFIGSNLELIYPSFTPGYIDLGNSEVWPGDANRNGVVNHFDLLSVGLANTKTGPERPAATTIWQEEIVDSWSDFIPTTDINAAHADTDGNGTVQIIDQTAIDENWTETTPWYNPIFDNDVNYPIQSTAAVPLFIHPDTVATNSEANFEIHLGTEAYQAQQIYGLAFSISYDDIVINGDQNIAIDFSDGWLGTFQEDLIATYRVFHEEQRIDVGITRIDGQSLDGHGKIGVLSVTIEDVIFRNVMRPFNFRLSGQRIVNEGSISLPSNAMETTSFLEQPTATKETGTNFAQLEIFPNPTRDRVWFNNHEGLEITDIKIYHQSGVLVKSVQVNGELPRFVELSELPAGVYLLTLRGADRVHSLKVVKW